MSVMTHVIPPEELAGMTAEQRQQVEDHIDGLITKTLMQPNVMEKLGDETRVFAKKLTAKNS